MARKAGFENLSLDLIYGLPGQTMAEWQEDVEQLLALRPEHISAYCLQWEEGTALTEMLERGKVAMTDDETEMAMYDYLMERMQEAGYEHYEVSNFARPGYASRHNSSYWNDTPYIGIGAAAHSYDGQVRSSNPADIQQYIAGAAREEEVLTADDRYNERIMLGLRTARGIARMEIRDRQAVERLIQRGLLCEEGTQVVATRQGLHILNSIIETLMI
jgi:oxygen-independent coproporphyrinogen-3 oxidase